MSAVTGFSTVGFCAAAALTVLLFSPRRDFALDDLMSRHERHFRSAYHLGLSLNVHVKDVAASNLTQSPLKQEAEYFETFALVHHDLMTAQPVPVVANRDRRPS